MDIRLMESYEKIEMQRLNLEEVIATVTLAIQADADFQTFGNVVCLALRDLQRVNETLKEEVVNLQRINGVGSDGVGEGEKSNPSPS